MGSGRAAYATIIAQGVSGVLCLIYIIRKVPTLHIEKRHLKLEGQCVRNQLTVGIPMALQFSITAVGTILVQAALNLLGSTMVASYSVSCKIEQLVTQVFSAMGVTMATYCAQNRGINDLDRIRKGVKVANVMSAIYAVVIYGVVYKTLPFMVKLFVTGEVGTVYGYARTYIVICGLFFIPLGMIFIFRNALQGCGFGIYAHDGRRSRACEPCSGSLCSSKDAKLRGCVLSKCRGMVQRRHLFVDRVSFHHA